MDDKKEKALNALREMIADWEDNSQPVRNPDKIALTLKEVCQELDDKGVWDVFYERIVEAKDLKQLIQVEANRGELTTVSKCRFDNPDVTFLAKNVSGEYHNLVHFGVICIAKDIEEYIRSTQKSIWQLLADRLDEAYKADTTKELIQKLVEISREFNNEDITACLDDVVPKSYVFGKTKETKDFDELAHLVGQIEDWYCEWFLETHSKYGNYISNILNADALIITDKLEALAERS